MSMNSDLQTDENNAAGSRQHYLLQSLVVEYSLSGADGHVAPEYNKPIFPIAFVA